MNNRTPKTSIAVVSDINDVPTVIKRGPEVDMSVDKVDASVHKIDTRVPVMNNRGAKDIIHVVRKIKDDLAGIKSMLAG